MGSAVKVAPVQDALTIQQAAGLLNVSRPYLLQLIERRDLPAHRTGKRRRVRLADLMRFKADLDRVSNEALAEPARQGQELQLGYD